MAGQLLAQSGGAVTGKVTDEKGAPLEGVSVSVIGAGKKVIAHAITDASGIYHVQVDQSARSIQFTFVGTDDKTIAVGPGSSYDVQLTSSGKSLNDVVVVGYGNAKRVGSTVGSITQLSGRKIEERPAANFLDALQGQVAGLNILSSSGEPSSTPSISINGIGSLTASATPLIVLDGIPIDAGSILTLNPQDFESISVLKDASATSIYGSRAANGVIYLTSKKGRVGAPSILLQTQYGWSSLTDNTKNVFNSFMNSKQLTDFWLAAGIQTQDQVDKELAVAPGADTKWYKTYYKDNVPTYQGNLSISGGGDKTTYYVSGGYFKQEGLMYMSNYDRFTLRSNINTTLTNWLRFGLNLSGAYDTRQSNIFGSNSTNGGIALLAPPFYSPIDKNGKPYYAQLIPGWGRYSPKYLADERQSPYNNVQFNPSAYIQVNPIKTLTLKSQAGMSAYDYRGSAVQLPSYLSSPNNGNASESFERAVSRIVTNTAEYAFTPAGDHHVTLLAGQEFTDYVQNGFNASSSGQSDDRLILLSAGPNNKNVGSYKNEYAFASLFGRVDYNYNDRYFLSGTVRQDKSSLFGVNNRAANFWSAGATWKAKKEKFIQDINWLTDLSVRASIGTAGNSGVGGGQYYQSLATVGTNQYGDATGWNVSAAGDPNLSWEKKKTASIGVSASIINRLNLDVEYYRSTTTDMLIDVPFAYTSGFSTVKQNTGGLQNNGINVAISGDVVKTRDLDINLYANFNYNKEKVTSLFQGKNYWIVPSTGISWAIGQPQTYLFPIFSQVNPTTGLAEWYLPNADPDKVVDKQTDKSKVTSDFSGDALQQSTGKPLYPPFKGGFGLNASYKGFSLQASFSFAGGKYLINNDRYFYENPTLFTTFNQSNVVLDYWKKAGDNARFPDPTTGQQFTQFDSRLIEDASFIRLKVLTLGYNLPQSLLAKTNVIKGLKAYVTGRNLLTWTKYTGSDPEVDSNLALGTNPNTRQVVFGLDFQF